MTDKQPTVPPVERGPGAGVEALPGVTLHHRQDEEWEARLSERWNVGRNQNGGVVLAAAAEALCARVERTSLLSITGHYLRATAAGTATVQASLLRAGRTSASGSAEVSQDGKPRLHALAVFGSSEPMAEWAQPLRLAPQEIPQPEDCGDLFDLLVATPAGSRTLTRSIKNFDIRVSPDRGWGEDSQGRPALSGWIRLRGDGIGVPGPVGSGPALLVALSDAFPPTVLSRMEIGWLPTLELTVHLFSTVVPQGWLRAELHTVAVTPTGLVEEDGELWDREGRLLARFRQLAMLLPS